MVQPPPNGGTVLHEVAHAAVWDEQAAAYMRAALGEAQFAALQAALVVPPLATCLRVNTLRTTPEEVVRRLEQVLPAGSAGAGAGTDTQGSSSSSGGNDVSAGTNTRSSIGTSTSTSTSTSNSSVGTSTSSGIGTCSRYPISIRPELRAAVLVQGSGPHPLDPRSCHGTKEVLISRKAGEAVLKGAQVFMPGVLACSEGLLAGEVVRVTVDLSPHASAVTRGAVLPAADAQQAAATTAAAADADDLSRDTSLHEHGGTAEQPPGPPHRQQQQQQLRPDRLCVGIGRACVGRSELFKLQHGVAVELQQRLYDVPSLNGQLPGLVMVQNLPSIVAAAVLNPAPGSRVLDMCAAPGGKTTALAQLMGGKGVVVALDRSHSKVDGVMSLARELGCEGCITAYRMDATKAVAAAAAAGSKAQGGAAAACGGGGGAGQALGQEQEQQQLQQQQGGLQPQQQTQQNGEQQQHNHHHHQQQHGVMSAKAQQRLARRLAAMAARGVEPTQKMLRASGAGPPPPPRCPGFPPASFDAVLLDAPCSASGLRPRLAQPLGLGALLEAGAYQRRLLAAAVALVKPGGVLVFSTCSVSPAENEANVAHVLATYPCLRLVPALPRLGGPGLTAPADPAGFVAALRRAAAAAAAVCDAEGVGYDGAGEGAVEQQGGADGAPPAPLGSCSSGRAAVVAAALAEAEAAAARCGDQAGQQQQQQQQQGRWWLTPQQAAMVQRFQPGASDNAVDTIGFFIARFEKVASTE